ncbi:Outer membrane protein D1 [Legionella sainthelensi]|nr:carbohydrate porin [Legionella sainthelensi]VEB35708.1 Outer membrane protein D1 [Legionella sainthelensi]
MPIFINGGVIYQGLLPRRLDDIAGLAVIYGSFSKDLRRSQMLQNQNGALVGVQYYETVIEAMYLIQATGWLKIQPDLQYIIKPGGTGTIPNALVLGAQVAVTI